MEANLEKSYGLTGAFVSEEFYHVFSAFATGFACLSNAMLIYLLITVHVAHVGPYRWLLLSFAVVDILVSIIHFSVIPAIHMADFGYIFWCYRLMSMSTAQGTVWNLIWVMLFYQTFVLISFHYVYRFVLLCNPPWLSWTRVHPWRYWITIAVTADIFYAGGITIIAGEGFTRRDVIQQSLQQLMMDTYQIDLSAPNKPGVLGIIYWTLDDKGEKVWDTHSIVTILLVIFVFSTSGAVIFYCLFRILSEITHSSAHFQSTTRYMQRQLFRALLWQTVIPTFTSYLPVAFIFLAPLLLGISFGGMGTILLMSTQIFPMIDPYLVLFFVRGYRKALPTAVHKILFNTVSHSFPTPASSVTTI